MVQTPKTPARDSMQDNQSIGGESAGSIGFGMAQDGSIVLAQATGDDIDGVDAGNVQDPDGAQSSSASHSDGPVALLAA